MAVIDFQIISSICNICNIYNKCFIIRRNFFKPKLCPQTSVPFCIFSLTVLLIFYYMIPNMNQIYSVVYNSQNNESFLSFDNVTYVYSAYCINSTIIIIAIIKYEVKQEYDCRLVGGISVNASLIILPEHHFTTYR